MVSIIGDPTNTGCAVPNNNSPWLIVLFTSLAALAVILVTQSLLRRPNTEPAVPYTISVPSQLQEDYQWEKKGKTIKASEPEVGMIHHVFLPA